MKQSGERHKILYNFNSLKIFIMREWKIHHYFLPVSHFFIIKERNLIKIYYLCKKFWCLLIVYRRAIREFINVVRINRIKTHNREIPVLKVLGLNPNGITTIWLSRIPVNKGFLDNFHSGVWTSNLLVSGQLLG